MKVQALVLLSAALCCSCSGGMRVNAAAMGWVRTPALDSAVVHTERIGGSFAYKTSELHVYSPVLYALPFPCPFPVHFGYRFPVLVPHIPNPLQPRPPVAEVPSTASPPQEDAPGGTVVDDDTVAIDLPAN